MQIITRDILKRLLLIRNVLVGRETAWRAIIIQPTGIEPTSIDKFSLDLRIYFENDKHTYLFVLPSGGFLFFSKGIYNEDLEVVRTMAIEILKVKSDYVTLHDMSLTGNVVYDFMNSYEAFFDIVAIDKEKEKKIISKNLQRTLNDIVLDSDPQILSQMKHLRASREKLHIMLVDDDPMTLRMVEMLLIPACDVVKYENVIDALDNYSSDVPHIVFLDINIPPYSGHDILKIITKYDKDAFVVMLSGNAFPENIKESMSHGASGFIGKPFSKGKVMSYLEAYKKRHNFKG
jgi:two-component system chemotaxis response regulator CheY